MLRRARPDIVFFQAGCDTLAGDPLARLAMTPQGIAQRDAAVINACVEAGVPVVMTLGGGYSKNAWRAQYDSIARTLRTHGLQGRARQYPTRRPSGKERLYVK